MVVSILQSSQNSSTQSLLHAFTQGIVHDRCLVESEIKVQKAWAQELVHCSVITAQEAQVAKGLLDQACSEIKEGRFEWLEADEDIHMNLERYITERAGDLGKKIHTGRSRNDLIATTLRLHFAGLSDEITLQVHGLCDVFVEKAEEFKDIIVPGQTHMQFGQPIRLPQILLAYVQALSRDMKRLAAVKEEALSHLPLGAGAFAGTSLPVNGNRLAGVLGFAECCQNSYDAVGDRDFLLSYLDAASTLLTHVAQQCQDFIYLSSTPVGICILPANWSTGSSIMPNKRNPDVPELIRAKAAKAISDAACAKNIVKSLCTSYSSDFHELKKMCIDQSYEVQNVLQIFICFCKEVSYDSVAAKRLTSTGHILATEIADGLCKAGVPFREAYLLTARLVCAAQKNQMQVHEFAQTDSQELVDVMHLAANQKFMIPCFESAVEKRNSGGGTSKASIALQMKSLKQKLLKYQSSRNQPN